MADFHEVPVIEIHNGNFHEMWPSMVLAIKSATFVAMDAELSGLGSRQLLFAKSIDDRYKEMCEVARTRSIISLGLSCFKLQPKTGENAANEQDDKKPKELCFQVQTFNIMILCSENYLVEPLSLKFLVDHGFDFNKQYAKGIPYYRGNDKTTDKEYHSTRQLFTELVLSAAPVVFHNALVDLIFLYQSFYANLPGSMQTFVADLTEVFSGGVYDTKYIAEFKARTSASYLEYVFRKCQRDNLSNKEKGLCHTHISFLKYQTAMKDLVMLPCALDDLPAESQQGKTTACNSYASYGWCSQGSSCPNSHDIDFILDNEDQISAKKRRKRQRRKHSSVSHAEHEKKATGDKEMLNAQNEGDCDISNNDREQSECASDGQNEQIDMDSSQDGIRANTQQSSEKRSFDQIQTESESEANASVSSIKSSKTGGHRAGFDSFMTGLAFAVFISKYGKYSSLNPETKLSDLGLEEFRNKVALSGKDIPLLIQKGNFAKTSKDHREKLSKIKT